jgi:uncharacterized protein (DUF305 family)
MHKRILVPLTIGILSISGTLLADTPFASQSHDAMKKMQKDMTAAAMTGDPDHDFVTMMIPHHQGAIDMAQAELAHGKEPEIRKMAQSIVDAQKKEIGEMQTWLKAHQKPAH